MQTIRELVNALEQMKKATGRDYTFKASPSGEVELWPAN